MPDRAFLARRGRAMRAAALLLMAPGCRDEPTSGSWTVSDSLGVRIVESDPSAVASAPPMDLLLSIGTIDGGGPTELHQVMDVELLDSTHLAVANRGTEEVRIFAMDGSFVRAFGTAGRGPRDFLRLSMVQDVGDSIFTYDAGNDRISVRRSDGELTRSYRLFWFDGLLFPVDLAPDGRALTVTARHMTGLSGTGRVVDTALVSIYDTDGDLIDSVGRLPHNERFVKQVGELRTTVGAPYAAAASVVGFGSGFCHAFGPAPEVRCYAGDGTLEQIWRISSGPRPVSDADVEAYWSELWAEAEGPYREAMLRVRADLTFPAHLPAISALVTEDDHRVWARRYQPTGAVDDLWWIFEGGRAVGRLTSPRGFEIMDVEQAMAAGVWRDELGVEHVRVYRVGPLADPQVGGSPGDAVPRG